jgi:hypothetical protein
MLTKQCEYDERFLHELILRVKDIKIVQRRTLAFARQARSHARCNKVCTCSIQTARSVIQTCTETDGKPSIIMCILGVRQRITLLSCMRGLRVRRFVVTMFLLKNKRENCSYSTTMTNYFISLQTNFKHKLFVGRGEFCFHDQSNL